MPLANVPKHSKAPRRGEEGGVPLLRPRLPPPRGISPPPAVSWDGSEGHGEWKGAQGFVQVSLFCVCTLSPLPLPPQSAPSPVFVSSPVPDVVCWIFYKGSLQWATSISILPTSIPVLPAERNTESGGGEGKIR
eukprot:Hpha_TRINITY_DN8002_c0_g1::TRINITY_DN8002_c0_g1_i1::g.139983::m.139983